MTVSKNTCEHFHSMFMEINQTLLYDAFPRIKEGVESEPYHQKRLPEAIEDHILFFDLNGITYNNEISLRAKYFDDTNPSTQFTLVQTLMGTIDEAIRLQEPDDYSSGAPINHTSFIKVSIDPVTRVVDRFVKEIQSYEAENRDQIFSFLESQYPEELTGYTLGLLIYAYRINNALPSDQECLILSSKLAEKHNIKFSFLAQGFLKNCNLSQVKEETCTKARTKVNKSLKERT